EVHAPTPPRSEQVTEKSSIQNNLLIYSGQIIRGKGVDVLLRALTHVKSDFKCLIFGDGGHRPYCEALCRDLGLADRVQFKGYVSQDELQTYYSQARLMVVSSVWPEPFGAVGLEGMHHALPVVAFDAGGIKEWLIDGYNGFLVPWMDEQTYAARVDELLRDKSLAERMGACGRHLANDMFNFSNYVDGLENMFDRVIKHQKKS
ncbi:MAG: glycosyltransferase, partial [Verrucomicrobia bacterium]|nr:glycosyltransferase [Verrucomicrobiota bacterium]